MPLHFHIHLFYFPGPARALMWEVLCKRWCSDIAGVLRSEKPTTHYTKCSFKIDLIKINISVAYKSDGRSIKRVIKALRAYRARKRRTFFVRGILYSHCWCRNQIKIFIRQTANDCCIIGRRG